MSERSLIVTPRADQDAVEIFATIAANHPKAAERFKRALQAGYAQLRSYPHLGRVREFRGRGLRDLRSCRLSGFPSWLIFYRVRGDAVEIARLIHGARDLRRALRD